MLEYSGYFINKNEEDSLVIEKLRLRGFKSFGKICEFDFNKNFTAIVGPNGSGKSNILDALKWILGEGSGSGLRIVKQSDLLFQGSESLQPAQEAEVILNLVNENNRSVLKRIYLKDSGSSFYLDNKKILMQDLNSIKKTFALEGEGFALIGQGEISETIHQKPKDRRKQLDILFGIERYRERRNESLEKLSDALNEVSRIETLIDELEKRREEISDDVGIAVQAKGIIDNLDILRRDYYFFKRFSLEEEQNHLELKIHVANSKFDSLNFWVKSWENKKISSEKEFINLNENDSNKILLDEINRKKNIIQRKAFQSASKVKEILKNRTNLENEFYNIFNQKINLEKEKENSISELKKLKEIFEKQKIEYLSKEKIFNESKIKIQKDIEKRKSILDQIAKLKISRSRLEAEIKAFDSSHENNDKEIALTEKELNEKNLELENLKIHKIELEKKRDSISDSLEKQSSSVREIRREILNLNSQSENLKSEVNSDFYSGIYPEPVKIILMASQKNFINSKPETVADVFSCNSTEAAAAIEAYLGARQYWLLVDTFEEAQEGINFLKQNRSGRVTYLTLERCKKRDIPDFYNFYNLSSLSQDETKTGWAMNLVKIKSHWKDAISHMMGDLLIVKDYETASNLIRQGAKFPIVTLEGEVFAPSGTVSGGASKQRTGIIVAKQKIENINLKINSIDIKISELEKNLEENLNIEKKLKINFENIINDIEISQSDFNSKNRYLNSLLKNLARLKTEFNDSKKQFEISKAKLNENNKNLEILEFELENLKDINEINFDLTPLKNELNLLNERLKVSEALNERVNNDYSNILIKSENIENEINSGKIQEIECRKELYSLGREKLEIYHEELKIKHDIMIQDQRFLNVRKRISKINSKLENANKNLNSHKNELFELENKISRTENEINQLIELWDEKYSYDKKQAREVEGGRDLTSSLRKLERELKSLGQYNLGALSEDQSLTERIDFLSEQLDDVENASNELKNLIDSTDKQVENTFTEAMKKIDSKFNQLFQRLFGGGEARMQLQEGENIWERGVEIFARPPGKKLQNISQLSGGEQSLTAIAQIFAVLETAGTPLAVLDEADAALDEYNLIRFAELAKEYSNSIQIIAMTHRRATMERADLIYGVTMIEPGLSKTVGINPENYK